MASSSGDDGKTAAVCRQEGCGRLAAESYQDCCRTCKRTGGLSHGPTCEAAASEAAAVAAAASFSGQVMVLFRIIDATLTQNFERFGRMDPQASADWISTDGSAREFARTPVAWNEHFSPKWNFTCRGQRYPGSDQGVSLEVKVWEVDMVGFPDFCGSARFSLDELWESAQDVAKYPGAAADSAKPLYGRPRELKLLLKGKETGTVRVQGVLLVSTAGGAPEGDLGRPYSTVNGDRFETPVQRLQVSGGTAPFYSLQLTNPGADQSRSHFIGKDLAHASDEINFYEESLHCSMTSPGLLSDLLGFIPEYAGVIVAHEKGKEAEPPREILVMRNMRDGLKEPRMLDIKMGTRTGQAGWQGKSRTAALRQSLVDGLTNSAAEGFRLEGFDHIPAALASMDPLLDVGSDSSKKLRKKAERVMLQRMQGAEMFAHFLDVHCELQSPSGDQLEEVRGPSELMELVLHETVQRLIQLACACRLSPVPQKWIGSSVALAFDCAELPPRSKPVDEIMDGTLVAIFDWGRSELNTLERHMSLSDQEQQDRAVFWQYYMGGVDRLAFEAARAYWHRYTNTKGWKTIVLTVIDFDSLLANDFVGRLIVPVKETNGEESAVLTNAGGSKRGTLSYKMSWCPHPEGSRLLGVWKLHLVKANGLPMLDKQFFRTTVDAFVQVTAVCEDNKLAYRQFSRCLPKTTDPEWDEAFEIPVMKDDDSIRALGPAASKMDSDALEALFPIEKDVKAEVRAIQAPRAETLSFSMSMSSFSMSMSSGGRDGLQRELDEAARKWASFLDESVRYERLQIESDVAPPGAVASTNQVDNNINAASVTSAKHSTNSIPSLGSIPSLPNSISSSYNESRRRKRRVKRDADMILRHKLTDFAWTPADVVSEADLPDRSACGCTWF